MKCSECDYLRHIKSEGIGGTREYNVCDIAHWVNPTSCTLPSDKLVPDAEICYNCKHWSGGGDFGLSCRKKYHIASTNGFDKACELFERR